MVKFQIMLYFNTKYTTELFIYYCTRFAKPVHRNKVCNSIQNINNNKKVQRPVGEIRMIFCLISTLQTPYVKNQYVVIKH